jgi:uncharacterized protein (DUF302 family)
MHRHLIAVLLVGAIAMGTQAANAQAPQSVSRTSPHSAEATLERIVAAIEKRGAKVLAKIDHAAAAKSAGLDLRPTTVLIFGNPRLGTPLMQEDQRVGLDLPLRVLVWQDVAGSVKVGYWSPGRLFEAYGISKHQEILTTMAAALAAITEEATGP